jgi:hypothetical protein
MMTHTRVLRSFVPVAAAMAVLVAVGPLPARARVTSSQTTVSHGDTVQVFVSSSDGCVEWNLDLYVSTSVSPNRGQSYAGGTIFFIAYNECTGEYLAGVNQGFQIVSGGLWVNGALRDGTAQFTTSVINEANHALTPIGVGLTFTATGDLLHNHQQLFFYGDGFASVEQDSEWFRPASVTVTFSIAGVTGTATGDGSASRGHSTFVFQTFGPPFP